MFTQLPEEKKDLIKPLYKKHQPNCSALWSYFDGKMTGKTFVDDMNAPTKAICRLDMSWTYISDDADLPWIEEALSEIIKKDLLQVIWVPERRGTYPLKEFSKIIPRFEFIERKEALEKPCDVEITPFKVTCLTSCRKIIKTGICRIMAQKKPSCKKPLDFMP